LAIFRTSKVNKEECGLDAPHNKKFGIKGMGGNGKAKNEEIKFLFRDYHHRTNLLALLFNKKNLMR
jgi:hypothetical protein